jgi:hypothetical protein
MTSNGYNLSSDGSCDFSGPGDLNNTDPKLGPLQNNGGPTQTQALLPGSPAIDAGNPSGCTDNKGNLLKTDQRGAPRPGKEDTSGCDMGAYERQTDTVDFLHEQSQIDFNSTGNTCLGIGRQCVPCVFRCVKCCPGLRCVAVGDRMQCR